ncbi:MAG: hypothetical protein J6W64_06875 [Bacilli bacterium]|nr:hypothetical protein [Bacilli bacterium]MBO7526290.1 hypothetical protein [Clostridia bacterium]
MAQRFRDEYQHFLNTATKTGATGGETWKREGEGVESLSINFNPQIDTYKTILRRDAESTFKNYQLASSVSGKRCYSEDPIYDYLDELRRKAIAGETQLLEIDTAKTNGTAGHYLAVKYDVLVTINEWLGEDATISYDINYSNPKTGYATISGETITFVQDADVSL